MSSSFHHIKITGSLVAIWTPSPAIAAHHTAPIPHRTARAPHPFIAICLLLLLTAGLPCAAQRHHQIKQRLPDSLSTSDENTPPANESFRSGKDTDIVIRDTESIPGADTTATTASTSSAHTEEERPGPPSLRVLPDSVTRRYRKDRDFAYANDPAYWTREEENAKDQGGRFGLSLARVLASNGFRYFVYILLGGVLLFAGYKIISENNLRLFYRSPSRLPAGGAEEVTLAEEDLDERLQQAIRAEDYRSGTRYLFLRSLHLLDERQLIRYHTQATNQEYVRQLSGHPQEQRFRFLTGIYEQVWYGELALSREQFEKLSQYYQDFYVTIAP